MPEAVTLTTLAPITLSTVSGGHVERQFQEELARVREVLTDPKRSGACRVTIALDFVPEGELAFVRVLSTVSSKLPPQKLARVVTIHNGELMEDRTSTDARQPGLFSIKQDEEEVQVGRV